MQLVLDAECFDLTPRRRLAPSVRYAGVLAVWCALFLIRPRLALQIYRERRADSPLRRPVRGRPPICEGLLTLG
jgi:hypothetical protein